MALRVLLLALSRQSWELRELKRPNDFMSGSKGSVDGPMDQQAWDAAGLPRSVTEAFANGFLDRGMATTACLRASR